MKSITDWRGLTTGLALFAASITLPLLLASQSFAVEWSSTSKEDKGAFIGVYPGDIDADKAEALDYKGNGVLVEDIVEDGPAEKSGLKAGDIITKIDSDKITKVSQFREVLSKYKPGDKVKVSISRDKAIKEFTVELGKRQSIEKTIEFFTTSDKRGFLGVVTESIEGDFAEYFGVKEGALIKKVVEDSPAEKAGLKAGDVLIRIDNKEIEETDDVSDAMRNYKAGDKVSVRFYRQGKESTIEVTLADPPGAKFNWSESGERKIIITTDDEVILNTDELKRAIREAMKDVQIKLEDNKGKMREDMEQLKADLEKLKKELEESKKNSAKDKK